MVKPVDSPTCGSGGDFITVSKPNKGGRPKKVVVANFAKNKKNTNAISNKVNDNEQIMELSTPLSNDINPFASSLCLSTPLSTIDFNSSNAKKRGRPRKNTLRESSVDSSLFVLNDFSSSKRSRRISTNSTISAISDQMDFENFEQNILIDNLPANNELQTEIGENWVLPPEIEIILVNENEMIENPREEAGRIREESSMQYREIRAAINFFHGSELSNEFRNNVEQTLISTNLDGYLCNIVEWGRKQGVKVSIIKSAFGSFDYINSERERMLDHQITEQIEIGNINEANRLRTMGVLLREDLERGKEAKHFRYLHNPEDENDFEFLLIPIQTLYEGAEVNKAIGHWTMTVFHRHINTEKGSAFFFDSISNISCVKSKEIVKLALQTFFVNPNKRLILSMFRPNAKPNIQEDGISCGFFCLLHAEMFLFSKRKTRSNVYIESFDIKKYKHRVLYLLWQNMIGNFINFPGFDPDIFNGIDFGNINSIRPPFVQPNDEVCVEQASDTTPLRRSRRSLSALPANTFKTPRIRQSKSVANNDLWSFKEVNQMCKHYHHSDFGCAGISSNHYPDYYNSLGKGLIKCVHCEALFLHKEYKRDKNICCLDGKVDLIESFKELHKRPNLLVQLSVEGHHDDAKHFNNNLRSYNRELSLGTFSAKYESVPHGVQVVKMNGEITWNMAGFDAPPGKMLRYGQAYTVESSEAMRQRIEYDREGNPNEPGAGPNRFRKGQLKESLLRDLHNMNLENHQTVKHFKTCGEMYRAEKEKRFDENIPMADFYMTIVDIQQAKANKMQYMTLVQNGNVSANMANSRVQAPIGKGTEQVAQVWLEDEAQVGAPPKINGCTIVSRTNGSLIEIPYWSQLIDVCMFILLFPIGLWGYRTGIKYKGMEDPDPERVSRSENALKRKGVMSYVSMRQWIIYMMAIRHNCKKRCERCKNRKKKDKEPIKDCGDCKKLCDKNCKENCKVKDCPECKKNCTYWNDWNEFHWLWWAKELTQEYLITFCNRNERNEMRHIREVRKNMKAVLPKSLIRAIDNQIMEQFDGSKLGRVIFAPGTFMGSRKYMQKAYADAMTICGAFGNPTWFLTKTANPEMPEFLKMAKNGDSWVNRPDIVCRIFIDKVKELEKDIAVRNVLGECAQFFFSVEHQKRGLPHIHMCVILKNETNNYFNKDDWKPEPLHGATLVNEYISAEIPEYPDPEIYKSKGAQRQRDYHKLVVTNMYHTCSQACFVNNKCSKKFPKPYSHDNFVSETALPVYRRLPPAPSDEDKAKNPNLWGNTYEKKVNNTVSEIYDNSRVVPHNRFLLLKYGCHINLEYIQGDGCLRYVLKYIMKGHDLAFVETWREGTLEIDYDEFRQLHALRYMAAQEAYLRLNSFPVVHQSAQVDTLEVHTEDDQEIIMEEGQEEEYAERLKANEDREERKLKQSQLLKYFELNKELEANGQNHERLKYTYATFRKNYCWDADKNKWKKSIRILDKLIRLWSVSPSNRELWALRLLLFYVKGPRSFDDMKTVPGENEPRATFREAAVARNLLSDDSVWEKVLKEAFDEFSGPFKRIKYFALLLANDRPSDPQKLFDKFLNDLTNTRNGTPEELRMFTLCRIERILRRYGVPWDEDKTACENVGLYRPEGFVDLPVEEQIRNEFLPQYVGHDGGDEDDDGLDNLNNTRTSWESHYQKEYEKISKVPEQKEFADMVTKVIDDPQNKDLKRLFYLTGQGGAGKTTLLNTTIAGIICKKNFVLSTAFTGVAAELLHSGRTCHSTFSIPDDLEANSQPKFKLESAHARRLRMVNVIIVDEISMLHRYAIEYIDRALQYANGNDRPFGGKTVILGGDWKQLTPIVSTLDKTANGGDYDTIMSSIKNSEIFKEFHTHILTKNMRAKEGEQEFVNYLKEIGTGVTIDEETGTVTLPNNQCVEELSCLIKFVFPNDVLKDPINKGKEMTDSAILCPTNSRAFRVNCEVLNSLPGNKIEIRSIDTLCDEDDPLAALEVHAANSCIEQINRTAPTGYPPHLLELKVGAVAMIIKNIDVPGGLTNGTRVQILKITENNLQVLILSGTKAGKTVCIGRSRFTYGRRREELGVKFERIQFPIRLCFAMTISKAQGQTLKRVGVMLDNDQVFGHGQLYVALSRVTTMKSFKVLVPKTIRKVVNVVWRCLLDEADRNFGRN